MEDSRSAKSYGIVDIPADVAQFPMSGMISKRVVKKEAQNKDRKRQKGYQTMNKLFNRPFQRENSPNGLFTHPLETVRHQHAHSMAVIKDIPAKSPKRVTKTTRDSYNTSTLRANSVAQSTVQKLIDKYTKALYEL